MLEAYGAPVCAMQIESGSVMPDLAPAPKHPTRRWLRHQEQRVLAKALFELRTSRWSSLAVSVRALKALHRKLGIKRGAFRLA